MKFNTLVLAALLTYSSTEAHKLITKSKHACDFLDENGEEISTSLVDNENAREIKISSIGNTNFVQLNDAGDDDTPEKAREKFALM